METTIKNFTPLVDILVKSKDDGGVGLGLVGAAVYGLVWRHCQMRDGVCKKSAKNLASMIGAHERTVRRHLQDLCDHGFIVDLTPDLQGRPHVYKLTNKLVLKNTIEAQLNTDKSGAEPKPDEESGLDQPRTESPTTPDRESDHPGQRVR